MGNNKVASVDDLACLADFEHLIKIDLESNPLCGDNDEEYRKKVFEKLPHVQVLDGKDRND